MFDAYTGTYNDLCNTIVYFRKLLSPRSAPVCGATCGMRVNAGFDDKIVEHFRPEIRHSTLPSGSRDLCEMLPICSSSIWHKAFDPPRTMPATIWRNPRQDIRMNISGSSQIMTQRYAKFPRNPSDCACSQHHFTEPVFHHWYPRDILLTLLIGANTWMNNHIS